MARGGARPGSGRKPRREELKVRELTSPYVPGAIDTVVHIMMNGKSDTDKLNAAKLLLAYHFGQPKQTVDHESGGEPIKMPIIQVITPDNIKEEK